jgi:hypothetical protein
MKPVQLEPHPDTQYLTIDCMTLAPAPLFAKRDRLTKINYATALWLLTHNFPVYGYDTGWNLAHLIKGKFEHTFHEYYVPTEIHNKLMNAQKERTSEQAFIESRPAQEAWLAGKPIQLKIQLKYLSSDWHDYKPNDMNTPHFSKPSLQWRPKPELRRFPFTLATLPANAWFKKKRLGGAYRIEGISICSNTEGIKADYAYDLEINDTWYRATEIAAEWEYSTDLINWHPAYTTVTE